MKFPSLQGLELRFLGRMKLGESGYPAPTYAWYVVVVLTIAYIVSFLDRQILALLVEPIKRDLDISDTQMSLLLGFAFALFYTLLGIPIGRLADHSSRRVIIASGITIWCAMTACCGLARSYAQLFVARVGVGVGEATLGPSALSLISDYFPPKRRARPLGFYAMGVSVGAGVALLIGGQVIEHAMNGPPVVLPIVGELFAWQVVFLIVGLPGLAIALVMTTVREPTRHGKVKLADASGHVTETISISTAATFLAQRWRAYGGLFIGMSGATMLGYGFLSWLPALFIRTWQWEIAQVATVQGFVMLIAGPISVNLAGWLADRSFRQGRKDAHMRVFVKFSAVMLVSAIALPLLPGAWFAVGMLAVNILGSAGLTAVATAALMMMTPNQMRGQVAAIYFMVISITGLTVGPTAIAVLTDYVFQSEADLRYSMSIVAGITGLLAVAAASAALSAYRRAIVEAEGWELRKLS